MMHSSNPPPLNTSFPTVPPSKRASVVFEPYVLYMISSVIRDLQFLCQQGYISIAALEEIIERLPKPVVHPAPHTPPAPSPSSSPIPQSESPSVSIKSDTSQKRNSNNSIIQRPISTSSQNSQLQQQQQQQQQQKQEQPLHSLAQNKSIAEEEIQKQSSSLTATPPPLHNSPQLQQNDDVVNAGQPQLESIPKPAVPSRASVFQPITPPQSNSNISPTPISNTGAILATRPLPLPPNASSSSPPRPQPLPVFNNKHEEAEYEKSINRQQFKDTVLPAYSLAIVEAMWDFIGDDVGDLSFSKGDIVEVVEYVNVDWWKGRIQGTSKIGIFPKIYTKIL
ncbi:hypothetical protein C1645_135355 [Glomus cerebriforme]|uniref:SH3 domain-containing protein n=1 Tax=Glomus cerebriforme TaxID=658196 RepID=A0A397T496_9GLOM|nr:hypothetical protein C1645_135355 [Glomus cerebriforme]